MAVRDWQHRSFSRLVSTPKQTSFCTARRSPARYRPWLEFLENRLAPAVSVLESFAGLNVNGNSLGVDPQAAVSPTALLTTVGADFFASDTAPGIALYPDKTKTAGTNSVQATTAAFFVTTGKLPRADPAIPDRCFLGSPRVLWDDIIHRFVILMTDTRDNNFSASPLQVWDLAVSNSATPTTLGASDWHFYQIQNPESNKPANYAGISGVGYNADAFVFVSSTETQGRLLVMSVDSDDLLAGVGQSSLHVFKNAIGGFVVQPTVMHDATPGDPMWLVTETAGMDQSITVARMTNVLSNSANIDQTDVPVTPYFNDGASPLQPDGSAADGFQGTAITNAAEYKGKLVAAHTVGLQNPTNLDLIQWFEFDVSGAMPARVADGMISDTTTGAGQPNYYDYRPSIDINDAGDIGLSFLQSGTAAGQYVSTWVTGKTAAGTMQAPVIVPTGVGHALNGTGTLAALSSVFTDPADGTFWAANTFVDSLGRRTMDVAQFTPGPPPPPTLGDWHPIGPAGVARGQTAGGLPVSGRVTGIAADPLDANTIFIATAGGGVWRTTDGGTTWTPLTDNLADVDGNPLPLFMGAIAETRDQNNNEIVYAGMGEANNSGDSQYGAGILVSRDGGSHWSLEDLDGALDTRVVSRIAIDPSDPTGGTAYVAVANAGQNRDPDANTEANNAPLAPDVRVGDTGIWKLTSFGQSFSNTTASLTGISSVVPWTDVAVDPVTDAVFAAVGTTSGSADNGVYQSTDGGLHWHLLSGMGSVNGAQDGRIALALYHTGTTQELLVSIAYPTSNNALGGQLFQLLKSPDGGMTFAPLAGVPNYLGVTHGTPPNTSNGGQGWYATTLAISATDPNHIYAAGTQATFGGPPTYTGFTGSPVESFSDGHGGLNWHDIATLASQGPHSDSHASAFDRNGNLLEGDDGGIFKLTGATDDTHLGTWTSLNGNLQITQFQSIAVDPTNPATVYGGTQDNGMLASMPGSSVWSLTNQVGDAGNTRIDPSDHSRVYTEYVGLDVSYSMDGGQHFTHLQPGLVAGTNYHTNSKGSPIVNFYAPYTLDGTGTLYLGTDVLNRSPDQGKTWDAIGTPGQQGFSTGSTPTNPIAIRAIAVAPASPNVVYVAAGNRIVYTRNALQLAPAPVVWGNGVLNDIRLPQGRSVTSPNGLAVDPTDQTGATVYAVVSNFTYGDPTGGHPLPGRVFKRTSFDGTWTDITGNLPNTPVYAVALAPDGKTIYLGTDVGVYASVDNGAHWQRFGNGLPNTQVLDLQVVTNATGAVTEIAAGTHGRGLWVMDTTTGLAPAITSTNNTTFTVGTAGSFALTGTGNPAPTFTVTGNRPPGVSFDGTSLIKGTPAAGSGGSYALTVTAHNGKGPDVVQPFTLTVREAPTITSANNAEFGEGKLVMFTVTTGGHPFPAPTISNPITLSAVPVAPPRLPPGVTFLDLGNGSATISGVPAVGAAGIYQIAITAQNTPTSFSTQLFTLTIDPAPSAPAIPSLDTYSITEGQAGSFTIRATGVPRPTIKFTGNLPQGVTLVPNADGTATLSGTPAANTAKIYPLTLTATNGVSPDAHQSFTLVVNSASLKFTSPSGAIFDENLFGIFTVTTSGTPTPTLTLAGNLPLQVEFGDNGDGTADFFGSPNGGTAGDYEVTITAHNGVAPDAHQRFVLTVIPAEVAPAITSGSSATFTVSMTSSFTVTTTGSPHASLSESGALPPGVSFVDNGKGTATLGGTPAVGSGGSYPFTITASNGVAPDAHQTFTLVVNEPPTITSAPGARFQVNVAGSFKVTTGHAYPKVSLNAGGFLPRGVTFVDNGDGTGTLAGKPLDRGPFLLGITAKNGVTPDAAQGFILTVDPPALAVTPPALPLGELGVPYHQMLVAAGGVAPYVYSLVGGNLPDGLTLDQSSGVIAGTPTGAATFLFTIAATDSTGGLGPYAHAQDYAVLIAERLAIATQALPTNWPAGKAGYGQPVVTTGGVGPLHFAVQAGSLPAGLALDPNSGLVSGTPTTSGTSNFIIAATDAFGVTASQPYSVTIGSTTSLPSQLHFSDAIYRLPRTAGTAVATVIRTGGLSGTVTVQYATRDGTAHAGTDYTATNGTLTLGAGVLAQTISIPILDDMQGLGNETFTLTLSNPTSGALLAAPSSATFTINDPLTADAMPATIGAVANALTHLDENFSNFITGAYQLYLKRSPDAGGLAYWIDQMQHHGVADEKLEASFLGSNEYIQNHGGTGAGWVTGMYDDLLGRDPDAAGLAYWTNVLASGGDPQAVALGFAASKEREAQRIGADYQIFLSRQLDAGGQDFWVTQFLNGARNEDVVGGFVGSTEFYQKATKGQNNRTAWVDAAFQDILHRDPTSSELAMWLAQLH